MNQILSQGIDRLEAIVQYTKQRYRKRGLNSKQCSYIANVLPTQSSLFEHTCFLVHLSLIYIVKVYPQLQKKFLSNLIHEILIYQMLWRNTLAWLLHCVIELKMSQFRGKLSNRTAVYVFAALAFLYNQYLWDNQWASQHTVTPKTWEASNKIFIEILFCVI